MSNWIANNTSAIITWCAALSTLAIYSILYGENRVYRLFEHVFIGISAGYGLYVTWSEILLPKWWLPMTSEGQWYWILALVAGSMFYFSYSKKYVWISRLIFGFFMGFTAGGLFRDFYEITFPQIGASMKPIAVPGSTVWEVLNAIFFYVILICSMAYFFFSFEHKSKGVKSAVSLGRWFLMIGFGAIFGATVMGRMTLFIGRFNFLVNQWVPTAQNSWASLTGKIIISAGILAIIIYALLQFFGRKKNNSIKPDSLIDE